MPPGTGDVAISLGSFFPEPRRSSSQPAPRGTAGGRARGADGSEDQHAPARRGREHVVSLRLGEELFGSGGARLCPVRSRRRSLGGSRSILRSVRSDDGEAIVQTDPDTEVSQAIVALAQAIVSTKREQGVGSSSPSRSSRPERLRPAPRPRLEADARTLADHFEEADRRNRPGHGISRVDWLAELPDLDPAATPKRAILEHASSGGRGTARSAISSWHASSAQLFDPPASPPRGRRAPLPDGLPRLLGGTLAENGLVAALTATSPPRLAHPDGGEPLAGTNPLAIAVPSLDGTLPVADVSMGKVTYGDVLVGTASPEELVPFGGEQAHKASHSPWACTCSSRPSPVRSTERSCSSPGRDTTPCPVCAPGPQASDSGRWLAARADSRGALPGRATVRSSPARPSPRRSRGRSRRSARLEELLREDPELARAWSPDGFTALHYAAFFGSPEAVRALVAAGADLEARSTNQFARGDAAPQRRGRWADGQRRGPPRRRRRSKRETARRLHPLMEAEQRGDLDLAELLIRHGAYAGGGA